MGTAITLDVGGMSIAWAKNGIGPDFGELYIEANRTMVPEGTEIDADGFGGAAFVAPLRDVVARIALLGHSIAALEGIYEAAAVEEADTRAYLNESNSGSGQPIDLLSFGAFKAFVAEVTVMDLDNTFVHDTHHEYGSREYDAAVRGRFADDPRAERIPTTLSGGEGWSERSHFASLISFLDPYSQLLLLTQNPKNLDAPVTWCYGPLVEAGWAEEDAFQPHARRSDRFLIATEGSSDVHILRHAFANLRPGIADFFHFFDVSESHPFSGVGNMVRFSEGLAKIDVLNRVVFLLDNDAEGADGLRRILEKPLRPNMRAMTLPSLPQFERFATIGPEGLGEADINGRAAAIECYLDLRVAGLPDPVVRWSGYKEMSGAYQGALERKERFARAFLDEFDPKSVQDTRNIEAVLDAIVAECTDMAEVLTSK